jgi:antitoxin YefM
MRSTVSYRELSRRLKSACDQVCDRHEPWVVQRRGGDVVLLARQDYEACQETAYLLSSPNAAMRLLVALKSRPEDRVQFDSISDLKDAVGV